MPTPKKKVTSKKQSRNFGGRATAVGVGYEAQVAASIAAKMLAGNSCIVWDNINGGDIASITMQDAEPVDDVVITLRGNLTPQIFISAKHRQASIAMTPKSPAFTDVIDSFVRQFHELEASRRKECRLMWAITSSSGNGMVQELPNALTTLREDASPTLAAFLRRRSTRERKAMEAFLTYAKIAWKAFTKKNPSQAALLDFARMVYVEVYDFGGGFRHDQIAEASIRSSVVENPKDSRRVWEKLELHFNRADRKGLSITAASLRRVLASNGLKLKSADPFSEDIELLIDTTTRNVDRLTDHSLLRFSGADIHIKRTEEVAAIIDKVKLGHFLITGEPGCGKSGLIRSLVEELKERKTPFVLLLAEEVFGHDWKGSANLPGLRHPLDEVLANWPDGSPGVLITDALDAVRDVAIQQMLRSILQEVLRGTSSWTVVASVREFDLKYGRELRESFPGYGAAPYASTEFGGVSHFHVTGVEESKLDDLVQKAAEIGPFIFCARKNPRASNMHRSPFFLRLAAELLKDGISPVRLADWSSPAILLRKFWEARAMKGSGTSNRRVALKVICEQMTKVRSMALSIQEISLGASELDAVDELRRRGIFQSPRLQHGTPAGDDELRFSHHLLHDYAVARTLIPTASSRFAAFAAANTLLPIFYRQSFLFALEELWDGPDGREGFWASALQMEAIPQLHGITRILAPILAARRAYTLSDLNPLLEAVQMATSESSPAEKALRHMASGLQDTDSVGIAAGANSWCSFVRNLSGYLAQRPSLETPIVHILARLNSVSDSFSQEALRNLNGAACKILAAHVSKKVSDGWSYSSLTTIESICRTYSEAPADSKKALFSLISPERLAQFPHEDLFDFANRLKYLGDDGDAVVLRLFEASFSTEPEKGVWENFGGPILAMQMQSSDSWNSIRYSLADYYSTRSGTNTALMTDIACIAWNSVVHRRRVRKESEEKVIAKIQFRGKECKIVQDFGHMLERDYDPQESRILKHFEKLLSSWALDNNKKSLEIALDHLAERNRTSAVWNILLEVGAQHPTTLGERLESLLKESVFLTHFDYSYAGISLLKALHQSGKTSQRKRLEKLILDLPCAITLREGEPSNSDPDRIQLLQDKVLGALKMENVSDPTLRSLLGERVSQGPLPEHMRQKISWVSFGDSSDKEEMEFEKRGVSLKNPTNLKLLKLRKELEFFGVQEGKKAPPNNLEKHWEIICRCEKAVNTHAKKNPEMANELKAYLIRACESMAIRGKWPRGSERWKPIERVLLKAAYDSSPDPSESADWDEGGMAVCGGPASRLEAAQGLLLLVSRTQLTPAIKEALLRLARDKANSVRFNMARSLHVLWKNAPELMWQLFDRFIRYESKFSILDATTTSLDHLWQKFPEEVRPRLSRIAKRAASKAPAANHIHETLAATYLFHFLRTGDSECESFIREMIDKIPDESSIHGLGAQLHNCRAGGWLTVGDAEIPVESDKLTRTRTWRFFQQLLESAQRCLLNHRGNLGRTLPDANQLNETQLKALYQLVDAIGSELFFASGAHSDGNNEKDILTESQLRQFWTEAAPLFTALAEEIHPHTIYYLVQSLHHLLPCSPHEVFLTATKAIISSSSVGFQHDHLAVAQVVRLIQRALADHREIFRINGDEESECLAALLKILDLFVEAGWSEARQLTHRLEEIYR